MRKGREEKERRGGGKRRREEKGLEWGKKRRCEEEERKKGREKKMKKGERERRRERARCARALHLGERAPAMFQKFGEVGSKEMLLLLQN